MSDASRAPVIRKGQRYRALADLPVTVHTLWAAPFSSCYERTLRADAAGYRRLQREFVPLSDRLRFWAYSGYALGIAIGDVRSRCELLNPDEEFPQRSFQRTGYAYEVDLNPVRRVNSFPSGLELVRWFGKLRMSYSNIQGEVFQEQVSHSGRMGSHWVKHRIVTLRDGARTVSFDLVEFADGDELLALLLSHVELERRYRSRKQAERTYAVWTVIALVAGAALLLFLLVL